MVSHQFFADDCLLFTNGSKKNIEKLIAFLEEYATASGQKFNAAKSSFYTHHSLSDTRKQIIASSSKIEEGSFPFTYLGAHILTRGCLSKILILLSIRYLRKLLVGKRGFFIWGAS